MKMDEQPPETHNSLRVIPTDVRRIIDSLLTEPDARRMATTQRFEHTRKMQLPVRERHCLKEIRDIGLEEPTPLSVPMQNAPMLRNRNYQNLPGLVKAIFLRALETNSIIINLSHVNFNYVLDYARDAFVCVLRSIQFVTVRLAIPWAQAPNDRMDIHDVAFIVRTINDNARPTTLHVEIVPPGYFIYTLASSYGQALNLPPVCRIHIVGDPLPVLLEWRDRA